MRTSTDDTEYGVWDFQYKGGRQPRRRRTDPHPDYPHLTNGEVWELQDECRISYYPIPKSRLDRWAERQTELTLLALCAGSVASIVFGFMVLAG